MKSFMCVVLLSALALAAPAPDEGAAYADAGKTAGSREGAVIATTNDTDTQIGDRFNLHGLTEGLGHGLRYIVKGFQQTGAALVEGVFGSPGHHHAAEFEHHAAEIEHHAPVIQHHEHNAFEHYEPFGARYPGLGFGG